MRATTLVRLLVLWTAILAIHLIAPTARSEVIGVAFIVLLLIDWVKPPNNANLIAAGNLWACLTIAFDAALQRPIVEELVPIMVIAISPLLAVRVRHALHA